MQTFGPLFSYRPITTLLTEEDGEPARGSPYMIVS